MTSNGLIRITKNAGQCLRRAGTVSALAAGISLLALGGCASLRPNAPVARGPVPASYETTSLAGLWLGTFNQIGAVLYDDNANLLLEIRNDGTFVEQVTPAIGSNNLAKASTWSGTVEQRGNRVKLKSSRGWTMTLMRSGNRLYGVAEDPVVEVPIAVRFQRVDSLG